jgi:hypothetical protein
LNRVVGEEDFKKMQLQIGIKPYSKCPRAPGIWDPLFGHQHNSIDGVCLNVINSDSTQLLPKYTICYIFGLLTTSAVSRYIRYQITSASFNGR